MNLENINTSKCIVDPKDKDFENKMTEKSDIFRLPKDRKRLLAYLVLVYDIKSEIRRNHPELTQRKIIAAEAIGFERNKETGHYDPYIEDCLLGKNDDFNRAICEYLYFNFNNDYKLLELLIDKYDYAIEDQRRKMQVLKDSERKNLQNMKADIEELEHKVFGGEETINLKRMLYEGVDNMKDPLPRKENEMDEFERDGLMSRSPFKNYIPAPLKFVGDKVPKHG